MLIAAALASAVFLYSEFRSPLRSGGISLSQTGPDDEAADQSIKANSPVMSVRAKDDGAPGERDLVQTSPVVGQPQAAAKLDATPTEIIARGWSVFEQQINQANSGKNKGGDKKKSDRLAAVAPAKTPAADIAAPAPPQIPVAAAVPLPIPPALPRGPAVREAKTSMIDFETAPFPYSGRIPGSDKTFQRDSETFKDSRVLLHIPDGFDAGKPSVIVVFFHGHGANLSDDVRERQQVPAQISASGVNAVLVAPQFAVNAADSSSGKFWQQDGFKRFLDESARQLAKLNGDPRAARAFARMPIVIVAYSGGFGPTLSILEHGGANSRIRGIVLLDALYSGTEKFANWIASNKTAFFVSAYTPHIRRFNAELERLLTDKSIAFGSELKLNRLPGSVTFLPTGDISHRDFVTHAWAANPIADILVRFDEAGPNPAIAADSRSRLSVARR